MTTQINVRIDSEIKQKFEKKCKSLGLSVSSVINALAYQTVNKDRIPFEISDSSSGFNNDDDYITKNRDRLLKVNAKINDEKRIIHFDSLEDLNEYMGDKWEEDVINGNKIQ
jgi:addiction module RelB/DinJ family antitoxin